MLSSQTIGLGSTLCELDSFGMERRHIQLILLSAHDPRISGWMEIGSTSDSIDRCSGQVYWMWKFSSTGIFGRNKNQFMPASIYLSWVFLCYKINIFLASLTWRRSPSFWMGSKVTVCFWPCPVSFTPLAHSGPFFCSRHMDFIVNTFLQINWWNLKTSCRLVGGDTLSQPIPEIFETLIQ